MKIINIFIWISIVFVFFSCEENKFKTHQKRLEEERSIRLDYIEKHNIPDSTKKDEGIYYIELEEGVGELPTSGDWILIYYTGYFLNGNIFDSNVLNGKYEPLIVSLLYNNNAAQGYIVSSGVVTNNSVIIGLAHGLKYMKKNSRARIIIPSVLGYGIRGSGSVPSYSTLIFEVEVSEIRKQ